MRKWLASGTGWVRQRLLVSGDRQIHHGAKREIHSLLSGPVMQVLRELVPEIAQLPEKHAFERTLDSVYRLDLAFRAFNAHPERFAPFLIGADGRPADGPAVPLACGRSAEQVRAMIVRSAARRYFRKWIGDRTVSGGGALEGWPPPIVTLLTGRVNGRDAQPASPKAERLYRALKPYLLYDWQVPLIPVYATLSPSEVIALGNDLWMLDNPELLGRVVRAMKPEFSRPLRRSPQAAR